MNTSVSESLLHAAKRVAPPSPVCSTEQVVAICTELHNAIISKIEQPMKQGYATRSQLSAYFGYEGRKGFNDQLDILLVKQGDKIRRFTPSYINTRGKMTTGVDRFCIADIERLLLSPDKKGR